MHTEQFPPALHARVSQALHYFASSRGGASEDLRLVAARKAICRHAISANMTPEEMVIAIGRAFEGVPSYDKSADRVLRAAYERLVSNCVQGYTAAKSASSAS